MEGRGIGTKTGRVAPQQRLERLLQLAFDRGKKMILFEKRPQIRVHACQAKDEQPA